MKPLSFYIEKNPSKKQKIWRNFLLTLSFLGTILIVLLLWTQWTEQFARWTPSYPSEPLPAFSKVSDLESEELNLIFAQTGLSEIGLQRLEDANRLEELDMFHRAYFLEAVEIQNTPDALADFSYPLTSLPMDCAMNSPISWEEAILDLEGNRGAYLPMVPLEAGDVLLTINSHSFGWRQGHSALVVTEETTLESVVLGSNSVLQNTWKWQGFPAVIILRPKDASLRQSAVDYALNYLVDIPYLLTIGVLSNKFLHIDDVSGTNCSHLVWQAYQWAGADIDANGGIQVLPGDMARSEHLEIVQIWGIDPDKMWA